MKVIARDIFVNADGKGKGLGNFFKDSDNVDAVTNIAAKGKELIGGFQQQRAANKQAEADARMRHAEMEQKAKSKRTMLIVGGVAGGLLILSVGLYFAFRKK